MFQTFVPTDAKDGDYWAKRDKNNFAARRSREARRLKENQIALRTAFLEKENHQLKVRLETKSMLVIVKSLISEATPSATPFFKRAYKISHPPRL